MAVPLLSKNIAKKQVKKFKRLVIVVKPNQGNPKGNDSQVSTQKRVQRMHFNAK